MPRVIGLTGNIACGKTTVGNMLLELGAERYIDADALVHSLYEPGQPVTASIAHVFGPSILTPEGRVDRRALGNIVFRDPEALQRLEAIVHPAVGAALLGELSQVSPSGIAVVDAVKLLEGKTAALCQSKWLVICSPEQELRRLMERNRLSEEEALVRLRAQPSVERRLPLVDEVIDNSGSLEETRRQVAGAFARFCQRFPPEGAR
ncbi:dephospho-CoA kinase [Thermogemmatispora carboxidivorans]|uniref:dephospho-CoA kinase n=1 Tax=Thermogemmatispora carboxidivorans TaxID=1382306 RepID=UPI00069A3FF4|nr:dephospho-CoA kinase [Thermogemmatispora carboxidivorans]